MSKLSDMGRKLAQSRAEKREMEGEVKALERSSRKGMKQSHHDGIMKAGTWIILSFAAQILVDRLLMMFETRYPGVVKYRKWVQTGLAFVAVATAVATGEILWWFVAMVFLGATWGDIAKRMLGLADGFSTRGIDDENIIDVEDSTYYDWDGLGESLQGVSDEEAYSVAEACEVGFIDPVTLAFITKMVATYGPVVGRAIVDAIKKVHESRKAGKMRGKHPRPRSKAAILASRERAIAKARATNAMQPQSTPAALPMPVLDRPNFQEFFNEARKTPAFAELLNQVKASVSSQMQPSEENPEGTSLEGVEEALAAELEKAMSPQ